MAEEETETKYPIDERCKDCSLFQVVEDIKKQLKKQAEEIAKLKKELEKYRKLATLKTQTPL